MKKALFRGFTVIEIAIVAAILVLLAFFCIPYSVTFFRMQKFEEQADQVVSVVRTARNQALFGKNGAGFGVKFFPSYYVVFEGDSYAARAAAKDERFSLPPRMQVNQSMYPDEIRFGKSTGIPAGAESIYIAYGDISKTVSFGKSGAEEVSQAFQGTAPTGLPVACYSLPSGNFAAVSFMPPRTMVPASVTQEFAPAWANADGMQTAGDGSVASAQNAQNAASYLPGALKARAFADIVSSTLVWAGAQGVMFDILVSGGMNATDSSVRLTRTENGAQKWSGERAKGRDLSFATSTWVRYGGPKDLWDMQWTKADIDGMTGSGFGFDFAPKLGASASFVPGVASTTSRISVDGAVMTMCGIINVDPCTLAGGGRPSPAIMHASTLTQDPGPGWSNLTPGAQVPGDGSEASSVIPSSGMIPPANIFARFEPWLSGDPVCVPANATITGITFTTRAKSTPTGITATAVQVWKGDQATGGGQVGGPVTSAYADTTYCSGGVCDSPGIPFSSDDINQGRLAMKLTFAPPSSSSSSITVYVDGMMATVTYSVPGGASAYESFVGWLRQLFR